MNSLVLNDYVWEGTTEMTTPRTFRRPLVAALAAVTLLSIVPGSAQAGYQRTRENMFDATNHSRLVHDRRAVDLRLAMSDLARQHSIRMANQGRLFHTTNPTRYYLKGVRWSVWGENVGWTTGSVSYLQQLFMASPPHRANILNNRFVHTAVGTVRRNGKLWVTVFFYG
jgi:uncharacterized protein YkwD